MNVFLFHGIWHPWWWKSNLFRRDLHIFIFSCICYLEFSFFEFFLRCFVLLVCDSLILFQCFFCDGLFQSSVECELWNILMNQISNFNVMADMNILSSALNISSFAIKTLFQIYDNFVYFFSSIFVHSVEVAVYSC